MDRFYNQNSNSFKPLSQETVTLDFSGCRTLGEIHRLLKETLGFPDYYEENRDALEDCLDDRFCVKEAYQVNVVGFSSLSEDLQARCAVMWEVFDDIQKEHPNVTFSLISQVNRRQRRRGR